VFLHVLSVCQLNVPSEANLLLAYISKPEHSWAYFTSWPCTFIQFPVSRAEHVSSAYA
jgi:hypothetical protein